MMFYPYQYDTLFSYITTPTLPYLGSEPILCGGVGEVQELDYMTPQ